MNLEPKIEAIFDWLERVLSRFVELATSYPLEAKAVWIRRAFFLATYLAGSFILYYTLNGGAIQLNLHDWAEVTAPRYAFLKDAVTSGQLPLHMPGEWALRNVTDRFLAVPDTNLGPQLLFLPYFQLGRFILFNTLLVYTIGFIGLIILARYLRLSPLTFAILFGLLFMNGHIIDHLVVGHVNWAANFLFPFFGYLILRLLDGWKSPSWAGWMALYMFVLLLQGAFHFFVACLLFLGLLWVVSRSHRRPIFLAALLTAGVGAIRILPPLLELRGFDTAFLSGYPTVLDLVSGLVVLKPPIPEIVFYQSGLTNLDWWEFDLYVGLAGGLFIFAFGLSRFRDREGDQNSVRILALPLLFMTALAIGRIYRLFEITQFPLLASQRVSSRLIFVPFAMLAILAAHSFQQWLSKSEGSNAQGIAATLGSLVIANDLWQHTKLWRIVNMGRLFPPKDLDLSVNVVANHADSAYHVVLTAGAVISTISLLLVVILVRQSSEDMTR